MDNRCCACGSPYLESTSRGYECQACGYIKQLSHSDLSSAKMLEGSKAMMEGRFTHASEIFARIAEDNADCYDALFLKIMADYGVIFVEDPSILAHKTPTINLLSYKPVYNTVEYIKMEKITPHSVWDDYKSKLTYLENVRDSAVKFSQKEKPFDIFISYKKTDPDTLSDTSDSMECYKLYNKLLAKGYKVFFSQETLQNYSGYEYEPIIFNAINTARVMIVYGEKAEYFTSPWVKNEWLRYFKMMKIGKKSQGSLIPVYKNIDAYELPVDLKNIQALNAEDNTFYLTILDKVGNILRSTKPLMTATKINLQGESEQIRMLIDRADGGDTDAMYWLARHFQYKNPEKTYEYFTQLYQMDNALGTYGLGILFGSGIGVNVDIVRSKGFFLESLDGLEKLSAEGNMYAQYNLGYLYYEGKVVNRNISKAIELFTSSANLGNASAQKALGSLYLTGENLKPNIELAVQWYTKSAEHGDDSAAYDLAKLYLNGTQLPKNEILGAQWMLTAANKDNLDALVDMGRLFFNGVGITADKKKGVELLKKAAGRDSAEANYLLGMIYENGMYFNKDYVHAAELYKKAADKGHKQAQEGYDRCNPRNKNNIFQNFANSGFLNKGLNMSQGGLNEIFNDKKNSTDSNTNTKTVGGSSFTTTSKSTKETSSYSSVNSSEVVNAMESMLKSADLFKKNSSTDDGDVEYMMGVKYHVGDGVKVDYNMAVTFYEQAANLGNAKAKEALKKFKKNIFGKYKLV